MRNKFMRFNTSSFSPPDKQESDLESEHSLSESDQYDRDFGDRVGYYWWLSHREDQQREKLYGLAARDSRRRFTPEALREAVAWFGPQNYP
jgi:hypothetical protein